MSDNKNALISEGVKQSWADPAVRAKRAARHAVRIGDALYPSMAQALAAVGLPKEKSTNLRVKLVKDGFVEFQGVRFDLVS